MMRTFIHVVRPTKSTTFSSHARYISERERNRELEEVASRPLFTRDKDGIKHRAADRYLAGGDRPKARSNEIFHIIFAFNAHDRRQLKKLEKRHEIAKAVENEDPQLAKLRQVSRDLPYAEVVRKMITNLEERTVMRDLRYVMAVHRHTAYTHVHLLLRRDYTSLVTNQREIMDKLPKEFLNMTDERGKRDGGLLDKALSDSLDTMIKPRPRAVKRVDEEQVIQSKEIQERSSIPLFMADKKYLNRDIEELEPSSWRLNKKVEQREPDMYIPMIFKPLAPGEDPPRRKYNLLRPPEERSVPANPVVGDDLGREQKAAVETPQNREQREVTIKIKQPDRSGGRDR
jgi:hypothetical protein